MSQRLTARRLPLLALVLLSLLSALLLASCGDKDKEEKAKKAQQSAQQSAQPRGNTRQDSFGDTKRELLRRVFFDHRVTFYCQASFDEKGNVTPPPGFRATKHQERAGRLEWEHVVPAENFGRSFTEWREGHPDCRDARGPFKGRKCAERVNREYRLMQADMYNLQPAIGAVNALRANYNYALLPGAQSSFGDCQMKIEGGRAEPPEHTRGEIARTQKYMAWAYPRYNMSRQQEQLMDAWDRMYPVSDWECLRARRVEGTQGNENPFVKEACRKAGLWRE